MKRQYLLATILFTSVFLLLLFHFYFDSPKTHEKKEKFLRISLRTEPFGLDPRKMSDGITSQFYSFIYDGLTRMTHQGVAEPSLAEKIEISEDETVYTFYLRKAKWSNGDPITAKDFANSYKLCLDPSFVSYNPDYLFVIKGAKQAYLKQAPIDDVGIECVDDKTLRITLEHPCSHFLQLVSNKMFFPVHHSFNEDSQSSLKHSCRHIPVCGPFTMKKWSYQNKIVLEKNLNYWDEKSVKLSKIHLHIIEDEMTQLSMFENNELDWAGAPLSLLPNDSLGKLKQGPNFYNFSTASLYFYNFNTRSYPLNNTKLRKALTYAINRKELIEHISQGGEVPALAYLPLKMHGFHKEYFQDGDIEAAKVLFEEALEELGVTLDKLPPIILSYPNVQCRHVLAQAIQQQWQKALNLKVQLDSKEWQVFLSDINSGNFQIAALGRGTHHLDPLYFLSLFKRKDQKTNRSGWENLEYRNILEKCLAMAASKQRDQLLLDAEGIFMDEMPIAPIFYPSNFYLKNPKLKNVLLTDVGGIDFKWAFFE